ncbi:MAG: acyltransferase family protein [Rhodomicrobium sp.]
MKKVSQRLAHPKYRADIDGLRAVAVLSVVGFHAFPNVVRGGFIGVDIFFVISGFLISTIIFKNLERGTFSFSEFYSRRIRRIFPALLIVLVSCFAFGWFALLSDEFKQLGKHIAGGAGFISNFLFWNEKGYFDNAAETKPLLHLWSLGIEEQFYIAWPFLIWVAWSKRLNLAYIITAIAIISFTLNIRGIGIDTVATFYSPQTRFWELLCGSLLAWLTLYKPGAFVCQKQRLDIGIGRLFYGRWPESGGNEFNDVQSIFGLLLIALGMGLISKDTYFPGAWALLPTLGTVLIISAGAKAWLNRTVLSNRVLVWFGIISFPLYLWHWPLLSFSRIIQRETPLWNTLLVFIAIVLAWITYRLIEHPIRFSKRGNLYSITLALLMIVAGYAGFSTYERDGLVFRSASAQAYEGDVGQIAFFKYLSKHFHRCAEKNIQDKALRYEGYVRCIQSQENPNVDIALIGDSHAEHLFIGLAESLPNKNIAYYIRGTAPFVSNKDFSNIFDLVRSSKTIRKVILTMHWVHRLREVPSNSSLETEISRTVDVLLGNGIDVYIAEDVPHFPFEADRCKGRRLLSKMLQLCAIERKKVDNESDQILESLRTLAARNSRIKLIELQKYLCDAIACSMLKENRLLYRDANHLNIIGSQYIGSKIVEDNPDLRQ